MIALTFSYKRMVHIRRETFGGMDSEYSHAEVQETTLTVVVPRDDDQGFWYQTARAYVERYAGNNRDTAFAFTGPVVKTKIHAILSEVRLVD
jgi:hypothetical protein